MVDGASGYTTGTGSYTKKVKIVSVHVRYFSFFSFFSLCLTGYVRLRRLHQVMSVYVEGTGRGARQKASEVLSECINDDEHFIIYFYAFLRFEARVP